MFRSLLWSHKVLQLSSNGRMIGFLAPLVIVLLAVIPLLLSSSNFRHKIPSSCKLSNWLLSCHASLERLCSSCGVAAFPRLILWLTWDNASSFGVLCPAQGRLELRLISLIVHGCFGHRWWWSSLTGRIVLWWGRPLCTNIGGPVRSWPLAYWFEWLVVFCPDLSLLLVTAQTTIGRFLLKNFFPVSKRQMNLYLSVAQKWRVCCLKVMWKLKLEASGNFCGYSEVGEKCNVQVGLLIRKGYRFCWIIQRT